MSTMPEPKPEVAKRTPWPTIIVSVLIVIALVAYVIPAYQGYKSRSLVTRAIGDAAPLRTRIDEFYQKGRALPEGAEAAAFRTERDLTESQSIVWSPTQRMLVVTMGDNMHRGKRFGFTAKPGAASLEWRCSTIDLAPKYLPAACR